VSTGTSTLERVEDATVLEDGTPRYAHIVFPKHVLTDAIVMGTAVKALCGHVFVPGRDPGKFPVCSLCVAAYEEIHGEINDDVDGMAGR
jgi:hypothetical protein